MNNTENIEIDLRRHWCEDCLKTYLNEYQSLSYLQSTLGEEIYKRRGYGSMWINLQIMSCPYCDNTFASIKSAYE